ncbi:hypothetical protein QJQ45_001746 [Haematococcus lacustris]|nr:hypothetical protein QJQ45_001746 [Haematococcus lacustris]
MRPLSLGSASSFKRPFFYSQFGPIVDGKRQCLHCPAQLAATEVSNPTHLRTHLLTSKKCGFLSSTAAAEIAKTESCVASKLPASSTQNLPTPPTPTHALFNWVVQEAIPFSVVESPAFQAFVAALNPSFVLPSRYSTFMLDCVHTEADSVTAVYIANMFDEVISKHNLVDKACAFVTDTPSTNKAAWRLVEQRHPKVLSVGCWMHILDLYLHQRSFAPLLQAAAQRVLCIPATAAANERVFSSFKHIWSDKRSSLLLGRMWLLAFIYFNKRVLERRPKPQPEAEWQQFACWMQHMPVEA